MRTEHVFTRELGINYLLQFIGMFGKKAIINFLLGKNNWIYLVLQENLHPFHSWFHLCSPKVKSCISSCGGIFQACLTLLDVRESLLWTGGVFSVGLRLPPMLCFLCFYLKFLLSWGNFLFFPLYI